MSCAEVEVRRQPISDGQTQAAGQEPRRPRAQGSECAHQIGHAGRTTSSAHRERRITLCVTLP
jgi:hypothetical protein